MGLFNLFRRNRGAHRPSGTQSQAQPLQTNFDILSRYVLPQLEGIALPRGLTYIGPYGVIIEKNAPITKIYGGPELEGTINLQAQGADLLIAGIGIEPHDFEVVGRDAVTGFGEDKVRPARNVDQGALDNLTGLPEQEGVLYLICGGENGSRIVRAYFSPFAEFDAEDQAVYRKTLLQYVKSNGRELPEMDRTAQQELTTYNNPLTGSSPDGTPSPRSPTSPRSSK